MLIPDIMDSMTVAAMTEPIWPPVLAPTAYNRRKLLGFAFCPS